jgi:hypothetical protein
MKTREEGDMMEIDISDMPTNYQILSTTTSQLNREIIQKHSFETALAEERFQKSSNSPIYSVTRFLTALSRL